MKVRNLLKVLESTDPECDVIVRIRFADCLEASAPLQHAYVVDVKLGEIELTLEVGKTH